MARVKPFSPRTERQMQSDNADMAMKYRGCIIPAKTSSHQVGVVIQKTTGKHLQIVDMLRHEGIFHDVFFLSDFLALENFPRLVVIVSPATVQAKDVARFKAHVEAGNGLLVIGKIPPLENVLGIMYKIADFPFPAGGRLEDSIGEGYAQITGTALAESIPADWWPLHAFGSAPVIEDGASVIATYKTVHQSDDQWAAITINSAGKGCAMQIAIDIALTVRHVQEGRYVDQDGIPPADGLSPIDDGILKCEDGLVLDWTRDRRFVSPAHKIAAFMVPVADAWRRIFVSCLEIIADRCSIPVKRAWYWPGGKQFVALISHDSDGNDEKLARHLLLEIDRAGIHTTWCVMAPGYSKSLCDDIVAQGHEIALHFDAISYPDGKQQDPTGMAALFTREMLEKQLMEVRRRTGHDMFYSNKNHYTRWAGRTQFFEWCEQLGLHADQSKGPSKCGTLGFPFGSCHPWQPVRDDGTLVGCIEIGFQSQDFGLQGPADTAGDILAAVKQANGVAHVIFHPAHSWRDDVNKSMRDFIARAKELGATFMTSQQIAEWTFNRKWLVAAGTG
ncbi:MAG: hypothetical protein Q6373_024165, partial [Candidatus Sigynarchaeota archaeon]